MQPPAETKPDTVCPQLLSGGISSMSEPAMYQTDFQYPTPSFFLLSCLVFLMFSSVYFLQMEMRAERRESDRLRTASLIR